MSEPIAGLTAALAARYRVEREIGQGGMAIVYLARDLRHDRPVALKVLRPELGAVLGVERFLAEIRVTASLQHPNLLPLFDSGEADGLLFYVMPFVDGESLRARLDREKQLPVDEAVRITVALAGALEQAHRHGVIHRDLKPENILMQAGQPVIADFGIALAVKEAGGDRLTQTGLSLGTPQYMSPEQATGDRTIDARSDIYSLASVLYEMLAGEPPVTGPNAQVMIAKLLTERPVRVKVVRDSVPDAIDAAIARALSKVPADRFATAGEFSKSLIAMPATEADAGNRSRWLVGAGAAVAVAAIGAIAVMGLRGRSSAKLPFAPHFEQLTTDGNAHSPSLSPDGNRLAYVARDCDERGRCSDRLVVRDIGNAGALTVMKAPGIGGVGWVSGGRFLAANNTVVSALGGAPRSLPGLLAGGIGSSDTVLAVQNTPGDTLVWLRFVTASDGQVRDSVALKGSNTFLAPRPSPRGNHISLISYAVNGQLLQLLDRSGRITDSLPPFPNTLQGVHWTPQGDALILQLDFRAGDAPFAASSPGPVPRVLVRYRVSADGRFARHADTLMTLERGSRFEELRDDGSALVTRGPVDAEVYALERAGPNRLDFHSRRLAASTAGLKAAVSRDGATVWLGQGASLERNSFVPFDGGTERSFDVPDGVGISVDWTMPLSSTFLYAFRDSSGQGRLAEVDVSTGRSLRVTSIPNQTSFVFTIPGGGYAITDAATGTSRVVHRPGKPDTTWQAQVLPGRVFTTPGQASLDGRAFLEFSQDVNGLVVMRRVPLDGGSPSSPVKLAFDWLGMFTDGSLEMVRRDSTGTNGWYRVAPGSAQTVRIGDAPFQGTGLQWSVSDDGKRLIVVKSVDRPDVYLLRNFGELLKR